MENTIENKTLYLYKNLKSLVVGDFSRYIKGSPKGGVSQKEILGFLNGINKNDSQQFDVDFNLKDGFEFYNVFGDLCRSWSHTIHAEHLTVIKNPLVLSEEDAINVSRIYNGSMIGHDEVKLHLYYGRNFGTNDTYIYHTPVYQYLESKEYALHFHDLSTQQLIEYGWLRLKN